MEFFESLESYEPLLLVCADWLAGMLAIVKWDIFKGAEGLRLEALEASISSGHRGRGSGDGG